MRTNEDRELYPNMLYSEANKFGRYDTEYIKRMEFARDNGCNTVMLTGIAEPQQDLGFIDDFDDFNKRLEKPFRIIEMQTTGAGMKQDIIRKLVRGIGVTTFSLSLSSFDSETNAQINGTSSVNATDLEAFCAMVKEEGANLRISINLTNEFDMYQQAPWKLFKECKYRFGADQVTLRELYADENTPQGQWIEANGADPKTKYALEQYIIQFGNELEKLEFGRTKYSILGMGVVIDNDCMAKETGKDVLKYAILRPNCKLYSRWDDPGSLIF